MIEEPKRSPLAATITAIQGETSYAIRLANRVLDEPGRDPDDDLSTLARQFLRARERLEQIDMKVSGR